MATSNYIFPYAAVLKRWVEKKNKQAGSAEAFTEPYIQEESILNKGDA